MNKNNKIDLALLKYEVLHTLSIQYLDSFKYEKNINSLNLYHFLETCNTQYEFEEYIGYILKENFPDFHLYFKLLICKVDVAKCYVNELRSLDLIEVL